MRSFCGTRYVRGWYIRENRSLIRMKRSASTEKMTIEVTREAAKAPAVCPSDFWTAALFWLLPNNDEFELMLTVAAGTHMVDSQDDVVEGGLVSTARRGSHAVQVMVDRDANRRWCLMKQKLFLCWRMTSICGHAPRLSSFIPCMKRLPSRVRDVIRSISK